MSATLLPFPKDRSIQLPAAPARGTETCEEFVNRMFAEAVRWQIEGEPSAAAIFMMAAAQRLQTEALKRTGGRRRL